MLKALLKKQFLELIASLTRNVKRKDKAPNLVLYGLLFAFLIIIFLSMFFGLAYGFYVSFSEMQMMWLYFALLGGISILIGIVGSVFSTYTMLYQARDNELLLSMPIKPPLILFSRMISVYITCFVFQAVVTVPAFVVYFLFGAVTFNGILAMFTAVFLLPLITLALTCILGYLVALIASKIGNNNIVTTVMYILFFVLYFLFYTQMSSILEAIVANAVEISGFIKTFLYPLYLFGCGASGDTLSLMLSIAIILAAFGIVYAVISRSFIKLATTKKSEVKKTYRAETLKSSSPFISLVKKEIRKFTSSPVYMFNCGMGGIMLVIALVFLAVKSDMILQFTMAVNTSEVMPLLCGAIMLITAMNYITAPSISLEGRNLWIVKSMPVSVWQVFKSKIALHIIITLPFVIIAVVGASVLLKFTVVEAFITLICCSLFTCLCALFGLYINLKMPMLDATSDTVVIKQSAATLIAMFIPWAYVIILAVPYFIFGGIIGGTVYALVISLFNLILCVLFARNLKTKGVERFNSLL